MTVATMPLPRSGPRRAQVSRDHRHQLVAIDDLAVFVDDDDAVGIAIERDADIGAHFVDLVAQSASGWWSRNCRLMLMPFGSMPIVTTSAPSSQSTAGATL